MNVAVFQRNFAYKSKGPGYTPRVEVIPEDTDVGKLHPKVKNIRFLYRIEKWRKSKILQEGSQTCMK